MTGITLDREPLKLILGKIPSNSERAINKLISQILLSLCDRQILETTTSPPPTSEVKNQALYVMEMERRNSYINDTWFKRLRTWEPLLRST
ncbi:hypothetical protein FKM82_017832 [Ascaphus truei]